MSLRVCPGCLQEKAASIGAKNGISYSQCSRCGIAFAERGGTVAELDSLYGHYYDNAAFNLPEPSAIALRELVRSMSALRTNGRWLDIGFGEGGLLSIAAAEGWSCYGVEASPTALQYGASHGWTVSDSPETDSRFEPGTFDVVTMIEFLEHVAEPDSFLRSARNWLRPGGMLYLTTPNRSGLNGRLLGVHWSVFSPPEHVVIWTVSGSRGAGLVLECVGVQPTLDLGAMLLGRNSVWTVVGLGGGHHDFHHGSTPYGTSMSIPYWGSRVELMEVIAMAREGRIHAETTEFPLARAVEVYRQLKAGQISGRAVLIPEGAAA